MIVVSIEINNYAFSIAFFSVIFGIVGCYC